MSKDVFGLWCPKTWDVIKYVRLEKKGQTVNLNGFEQKKKGFFFLKIKIKERK